VNIGLDRNFLAVVEAASGDYIWLMGDDDRLEPGGARKVLEALERWPGIAGLTLGVIDYDVTMTHATGIRAMPPTQKLDSVGAVFSTMAEVLGFMSALVVDRQKWRAIAGEPETKAYENYYVQVYIIGRIVERYHSWGVVQEPCVGFRSGNDQFKTKFGWLKRLKIDVNAYEQIAEGLLLSDPTSRSAMRKRIFATHVLARITNAKAAPGPTPAVIDAAYFLFGPYHGMRLYWTRALPMLFAPSWLIRNLRQFYKRFAKSSGSARARQQIPSG
jgi:glycosyltransferase involved in cell wall biosynthesis